MIDLSWSHILIVLIVALVVVGPKDLPRLMRIVGRWVGKARQMADQFRKSFDEMARQSELDELRHEIESLRSQRPLTDIQENLSQPLLPAVDFPTSIEAPKPVETVASVEAAAETAHVEEPEPTELRKVSSAP